MIKLKMSALECSHFSNYKSGNFSRHSRAANSADPGPILPNFEPIQDLIAVFVTCINEDDPIKYESVRVLITLYINFSDVQGQLTQ